MRRGLCQMQILSVLGVTAAPTFCSHSMDEGSNVSDEAPSSVQVGTVSVTDAHIPATRGTVGAVRDERGR